MVPGPRPLPPAGSPRPGLDEERRLWRSGHRWVAGLDEVGRGAWAGPVSVGVVVVCHGVPARSMPPWLRDSKLLDEERRETVFEEVAGWCADGAVGHASPAECDRWGMAAALRLASYRALAALELRPDALLVDGPYNLLRDPASATSPTSPPAGDPVPGAAPAPGAASVPGPVPVPEGGPAPGAGSLPLPTVPLPPTVVPVVGGDGRCAAVAAASVLAKVVRDRMMRAEAEHFPPYHFERNKGYPSPLHQIALRGYGLSAIHRRSWSFAAELPWR